MVAVGDVERIYLEEGFEEVFGLLHCSFKNLVMNSFQLNVEKWSSVVEVAEESEDGRREGAADHWESSEMPQLFGFFFYLLFLGMNVELVRNYSSRSVVAVIDCADDADAFLSFVEGAVEKEGVAFVSLVVLLAHEIG